MKNILIVILALVLSACGAYNEKTAGIEEDTMLVLRSESLVGLSVEITPGFSRVITAEDLTKFAPMCTIMCYPVGFENPTPV